MKLPPFRLHHPTSVPEASEMAQAYGQEAAFLSGGTELVLLMKLGLAAPGHLIDLKRIDGLDELEVTDGQVRVGALVTHRQLEENPAVRNRIPELARVSSIIANRRVRGTGTLVGNLCFADPHSDPATLLSTLDARLVIAGPGGGLRECGLGEFWVGPYVTTLGDGELVTSIRFPAPSPLSHIAHERFKLKERPAVTVSVRVETDEGKVSGARVAAGSAEPLPRRLASVERLLLEAGLDAMPEVAAAAAAEVDPVADQDGSADYKRHLIGVLTTRAAVRAMRNGGGGQ